MTRTEINGVIQSRIDAITKCQCAMCGAKQDEATRAAFHHHHIDPATKSFKLSSFPKKIKGLALETAWRKVATELRKTIYVCAFCHSRIHYAERVAKKKVAGE